MSGWMREVERLEADLDEAQGAEPYDPVALAGALERLVRAAERRVEIAECFEMSQLYDELSEAYENVGRYEDALAAMEQAMASGYRGQPDPRCRLAELHLRFGHAELAHPIFAQVKTETPDDVWLFNNAGLEYSHTGDPERALPWLEEGLELAMRTGDPERLVDQLHHLREGCLTSLGRPEDDLQRRAAAYEPPERPRAPSLGQTSWPSFLPSPSPVSSWSPGPESLAPSATRALTPTGRHGETAAMGFAWFPGEEFPLAVERWPSLLEDWGVANFGAYCRALQGQLLRYAAGPETHGRPVRVVPVVLSTYLPWCDEHEMDAPAELTGASYADERVRTAAGDVIAWPPARNDRCWCGSGRKYKQCCGTVRLTPDDQVGAS